MTADSTVDDTSTAGSGWRRIHVAITSAAAARTATRRTSRASFGIIGPRPGLQGRWKTSESSSEKPTRAVSTAATEAAARQRTWPSSRETASAVTTARLAAHRW